MADYKYAYNGNEDNTAKAVLKDIGISTKAAIEISTYLRRRSTKKAKDILELVKQKKHAIPYKRFTDGVGHRTGIGAAGRYPFKASEAFLSLIKLAEANASQKGLGSDLQIIHLLAHKASTPYKYGRQQRRKAKRSHIEIVVKEVTGEKKEKSMPKPAKTEPAEVPKKERITDQTAEEKTVKKKTSTTVKKTADKTVVKKAKVPAKKEAGLEGETA